MNPETLKETAAPSLDVVAEIDAACDRFEAEWRAGRRPRIEAFLAAASDRARGGLLAELLRVEIAHRAAQGETLLTQDYTPRFPEHASLIDTLLARGQAAGASHPAQAGRYRIESFLAGGGMGLVYRAHDPDFGRPLAIKVLREEYQGEPALVARFLEEARITGQLQHPGIPPVHEIGRLPDGRPFLAMKLIEGRTLADLLAAARDAADGPARLLPVFEQVCQTLAYAHAQGVIHRDLKPANVMVGAFGEVQVMDWGLAKSIRPAARSGDEPGADPPLPQMPTQETMSGPTVPGAVMGTLAFMPPEQARGEVDRLDERSDVFGLGAILCVLLTGRPPYREQAHAKLLEQARTGDLADAFTRLEQCGADPDLVKLAMRCLTKEPAARPRNAAAVAEVVAAYQENVRERLRQAQVERTRAEVAAREERKRRQLLLAAGGIIALVLLAGLAVSLWQMRRAEQAEAAANTSAGQARLNAEEAARNAREARDERDAKGLALTAEQQARRNEAKARQQAFAALHSMTTEVVERKFAQGPALTDDDRAFLRGVIAQFDAFAAIKGDDIDSRKMRAEGRLRVGNIRRTLGELQEAVKDYDQAVGILKQLAADFPSRPEVRQTLAVCYTNRGNVLDSMGGSKQAGADLDTAVSVLEQLVADFPSQPELRQELAGSRHNRGILRYHMGRFSAAEQDYDESLRVRKHLVADFPDRPEFREELAASYADRGGLLSVVGRPKEAARDYDQSLSILVRLVAEFPANPGFRHNLAGLHNNRALLLSGTDRAAAEKDYDLAISIQKKLAADFPSRPEFRDALANTHNNRGILLQAMGRLNDAEEDYNQAVSIGQQRAADSPGQPDLRNFLAGACVNLAILYDRQGNRAAAKRVLLEGRPHHLAALKANPQNPSYRQFYRNHLRELVLVHAGLLEQEDTVRAAETRRDLAWNAPADAYDAACFLSQCVPRVAKHGALDDKQRKEAVQFYGDAAMRLLRDAVRKGYTDLSHMKKDPNLDPLRHRDDFMKLAAELEGKPAKATPAAAPPPPKVRSGPAPLTYRGRMGAHDGHVTCLACSPDGRQVLSGGFDRQVDLWDVGHNRLLRQLTGHQDIVWTVAFSPDGRRGISGSEDRTLRLWDLKTGQELQRLQGHGGVISSVAFLPDGRHVISGAWDGTARLWDLETAREIGRFNTVAPVLSLALSRDGRHVVFGSNDGKLRYWDVRTRTEVRAFPGPANYVEGVALSGDGRRAVASGADGLIHVFDVTTGREGKLLRGHTAKVDCVALSPDGSRVLSCGDDATIRLWDLATGRELARGHGAHKIRWAAFSPDGRHAASACYDNSVGRWALPR